jgi:ribonuclease HI
VRVGRRPGIYTSWEQCKLQTRNYSGAVFKSFVNLSDAQTFLKGNDNCDGNCNLSLFNPRTTLSRPSSKSDFNPIDNKEASFHLLATQSLNINNNNKNVENVEEDDFNLREKSSQTPIVVYVDGACQGNGTASARAGYGVYFGPNDPRNLSEPLVGVQTNQRAELTAAIRALEILSNDLTVPVEIVTDSQYVIKGITQWIHKWKQNNWKTANNEDIQNKDLFVRLDELLSQRIGPLKWTFVEGHSQNAGNDAADRLAVAACSHHLNDRKYVEHEDDTSRDS